MSKKKYSIKTQVELEDSLELEKKANELNISKSELMRRIIFDWINKNKNDNLNKSKNNFTFIDLFAGIGGARIGLEDSAVRGKCIWSSEWDKYCIQTYRKWFNEEPNSVDIRNIDPKTIPDHDLLSAGFPCQPFSLAGVSKRRSLGKLDGLRDRKETDSQGNLFWSIAKIVRVKRPAVILLENVKNLKSHDNGNTWLVIEENLKSLGYQVNHKIIDAKYWVPQHRERIFIVCFDKERFGSNIQFTFPEYPKYRKKIKNILDENVDKKYILSNHLWTYLQNYAKKHKAKGNGFGYSLVDLNGISRTLSARYHKDGSEILIPIKNSSPRRLTPIETARLMGFQKKVKGFSDLTVSDTQAYKQFGNSVVVPVIRNIGVEIVKTLKNLDYIKNDKKE